jgi:methyl-accepting chemotaxis protein
LRYAPFYLKKSALKVLRMKISTKMTIFINLFLIICFSVLFYLDSKQSKQAAFEAEIDKARKIVTMAEGVREYTANLISNGTIKMESLKTEVHKFIEVVPVVSAMRVAESKAKLTGMIFKVPKISPRNPKNEPDKIDIESLELLMKTNSQGRDTPERIVYDNDKGFVRYYKAVRLTRECEWCHGDPETSAELWGNDQGFDPTGVKMENWREGEIHGAFEFMIPIEPIVNSINKTLILHLTALLVILAVLGVTTHVVSNKIIFNKLTVVGTRLKNIAMGKGDLTKHMEYKGMDEIGIISTSFNKFIDYIKSIVIDIQEQSQYMINSS